MLLHPNYLDPSLPILFQYRALQAVSMQKMATTSAGSRNNRSPNLVTAFLHAVFKRHFLLRVQCTTALERKPMKILGDQYKTLTIHGTEIYNLSFLDEHGGGGRQFMDKDILSLKLPLSLQPGYDGNNLPYECEVEDSPILPLLRALGAGKTMRVLSALLCEVRIIFISKYIDTLSSCVTSAMAMIAQGLLVWRHVSIPVLPPHLFRFLSAGAPYIVGVLEKYADRIEKVRGMKNVLSINLDTGDLKIYNMDDPKKKVPDLLESSKASRKQKNFIGAEMLARDLNEVLEVDRKLWGGGMASKEAADSKDINMMNRKRGSLTNANSEKEFGQGGKKDKDGFFDAVAFFVGTIQGASSEPKEPHVDIGAKSDEVLLGNHVEATSVPITKYPFTSCDNEEAEEMIRASLLSFFLELYGDLGMYLLMSKSTGELKVDKKKFLVRKSQLGFTDKTPMWFLLKQFSRSIMFDRFINGRLKDAERQTQKNSTLLLDHIPIFSLCQKHLRKIKSNFTTTEIRRVVFTTVEGCPRHRIVESIEIVRNSALALTSEKPFEGDEVTEIKKLIDSCKKCDLSFRQVMAVCWIRIGDRRAHLWKHNLLGLNLLKNFVLHGPITAVSAAVDGIAQIYALRFYDNKNVEAGRNIQAMATQLYFLLNHVGITFSRRRRALASSVQRKNSFNESTTWSNYLIRRLPLHAGFRHIHVMFSPSDSIKPSSSGSKRPKDMNLKQMNYKHGTIQPNRTLQSSNINDNLMKDRRMSSAGSATPVRRTSHPLETGRSSGMSRVDRVNSNPSRGEFYQYRNGTSSTIGTHQDERSSHHMNTNGMNATRPSLDRRGMFNYTHTNSSSATAIIGPSDPGHPNKAFRRRSDNMDMDAYMSSRQKGDARQVSSSFHEFHDVPF